MNTKTLDMPSFDNLVEASKYWSSNSRCRNVPDLAGKYGNMSREQAKAAYHRDDADLFIRKDVDSEVELYRALRVRSQYGQYRDEVRKLNVRLNPWVNWGTKA